MRAWLVSSSRVDRGRQRLFAVVVVAFSLAIASRSGAQSSATRVLLVSTVLEEPVFARIAAELTSQGFDVEEDRVSTDTSVQRLAELTAEAAADAGVVVRVTARTIHVAIVDRIHDQRLSASIGLGRDQESRSVAALRTVEFVRTTLVDLLQPETRTERAQGAPKRSVAVPPKPRIIRAVEPPPEPNDAPGARIGLGFSGSPGPNGADAAWHAVLSLRYFVRGGLGAEGVFLLPLDGSSASAEPGSVELRFGLAAAGVAWEPRLGSGSAASLGAGAGGLLVRTQGQAIAGYQGHVEYGLALGPYLRLGFTQQLISHLSARLDVLGMFAMPETVLLVSDQRLGSFGQPCVIAALGVEWEVL